MIFDNLYKILCYVILMRGIALIFSLIFSLIVIVFGVWFIGGDSDNRFLEDPDIVSFDLNENEDVAYVKFNLDENKGVPNKIKFIFRDGVNDFVYETDFDGNGFFYEGKEYDYLISLSDLSVTSFDSFDSLEVLFGYVDESDESESDKNEVVVFDKSDSSGGTTSSGGSGNSGGSNDIKESDDCVVDCENKSCGDDGCDGSCDECNSSFVCDFSGSCVLEDLCNDTCSSIGRECGFYEICGVREDCGPCNDGYSCDEGVCVKEVTPPVCVPNVCSTTDCGVISDGCDSVIDCGDCEVILGDVFYVSVGGSGNRDGSSIGNSMSIGSSQSYASNNPSTALIFILAGGNYGDLIFSGVQRSAWATWMTNGGASLRFTRLKVENSEGAYLRFVGLNIEHPVPSPMPADDGHRHYSALGDLVEFRDSSYVELKDSLIKGYNKYLSQMGVEIYNSDYITVEDCEVTNTVRGFMIQGGSNNARIIGNYLHHVSEGSGIRFQSGSDGGIAVGNILYYQQGSGNEPYFPDNDNVVWHPGSAISIRSDGLTIVNNVIHGGYSQGLMFYTDGQATYDNMLVEGNVFYDTGRIALYQCGRNVTVRDNTIIGDVRLDRLTNWPSVRQRYDAAGAYLSVMTRGGSDLSTISVYNNLGMAVRHPDGSTFGRNIKWGCASGSDFFVFCYDGSKYHGYPNFYEDTGFYWGTPEWNYADDGLQQLFVDDDVGYCYGTSCGGDEFKTFDFRPLITSVVCNGGYLHGDRVLSWAVPGEVASGALSCACRATSECVEVLGSGYTCDSSGSCVGGVPVTGNVVWEIEDGFSLIEWVKGLIR